MLQKMNLILYMCLIIPATMGYKCEIADLTTFKGPMKLARVVESIIGFRGMFGEDMKMVVIKDKKVRDFMNGTNELPFPFSKFADRDVEVEVALPYENFIDKFQVLNSREFDLRLKLQEATATIRIVNPSIRNTMLSRVVSNLIQINIVLIEPMISIQASAEILKCPSHWRKGLWCRMRTVFKAAGIVDIKSLDLKDIKIGFSDVEVNTGPLNLSSQSSKAYVEKLFVKGMDKANEKINVKAGEKVAEYFATKKPSKCSNF